MSLSSNAAYCHPRIERKFLFRIVLYLLPAIADSVAGIFYFIGPVRATILGADPLVAGGTVTARAVCLCLASIVISRFLTSRNAVRYLFGSIAVTFGICLLGLAAVNVPMLYVTSALSGITLVIYAASFQMFIKMVDVDEHKPLARVMGSYSLSWCLGMAAGPFITGILMEIGKPASGAGFSDGWKYAYLAAACLVILNICVLAWVYRKSAHAVHHHNRVRNECAAPPEERGKPDFAWFGWLLAIIGTMSVGIVNAVFPAAATADKMPEWLSGTIMMILSVAMGVFSYLIAIPRDSLYSGRLVLATGLAGVVGLGFFALPKFFGWSLAEYAWPYIPGAILFGCYAGFAYLYSTFHSLAHPDLDGRNVSINESCCATGMIAGSLLGGWAAKHYGFHLPFVIGAVFALALAVYQFQVHRRRMARRA